MTTDAHDLAAVRRVLGTVDRDGREMRRLTLTRGYPTTPEDLWEALTDPERIPRWFLPVTGDLRAGGRYQLEGNAGGDVVSCDPPRTFSVTWEYDGHVSWVTVTLTPDGTGTVLELAHDAPSAPEHWDRYGPGAVGIGWELGLTGLAEHVVTHAAVDPAAFAAWMASDDGIAFVVACSDAWAEARIAAGGDARQSRAAAARCTAAYTGQE
jgi:uncharacterized protein YndB with AHSA1/START domain